MKWLSLLLVSLATTLVSSAALEFSAYFTSKDGGQFVVTDLDTGSKSSWLKISDSFQGHVITHFDIDREMLTLQRQGTVLQLPLKVSRIKSGGSDDSAKAEIKVVVTGKGTFSIDGKSGNLLDVLSHFEEVARIGKRVSVTLHAPLNSVPQSVESVRQVKGVFAVSGAKGSINLLNSDTTK